MDATASLDIASLVAGIIDLLGKVGSVVAELRRLWQDADPAMPSPETQLAALNALFRIAQDTTQLAFNDPHEHLVMEDLDRSVACCQLLVNRIDWEVAPFQKMLEDQPDTSTKLRLLLQREEFDNIKRLIDQQMSALTQLLTGCNKTAPSEEKRILKHSQEHKMPKEMEKDTESLLVHRDVDSNTMSHNTSTSMGSSKRSIEFSFDKDLFNTQIYQRWIRGSVRKSLHDQQSDTPYQPQPKLVAADQSVRYRNLEDLIEGRAHKLCRRPHVLMLGSTSRFQILRTMLRSIHVAGLSEDVLLDRRRAVLMSVCRYAKALVDEMRHLKIAPESDQIWKHADFVAAYVPKLGPSSTWFDPRLNTALEHILRSPYYADILSRQRGYYVSDSAEYFFHEIEAISSPAYLPNDFDIYHTVASSGDFYRGKLPLGVNQLKFELSDVGRRRGRMKTWISCLSGITSIMFVADLNSYDDLLLEEDSSSPTSKLVESINLFDFVVNLPNYRKSSIILLLDNVDKFREKLATSPLNRFFSDYSGGNDITETTKYIREHFERVNRAGLKLYIHLTSPTSASNLEAVSSAVRETILHSLQASGASP